MEFFRQRLGKDGVPALAFLSLAVAGYIGTLSFPDGAALWPRWILGIIAFLSIVLLTTSILRRKEERP